VVSNGYTSKCNSGPYWFNRPFLFFYIRALALGPERQSASARVPECQKNKGGLDQYGAKRFGIDSFATIRKSVGLKGLSCYLFRQQSNDEISTGVWTISLTTPLCFGGWADAYELLMSLISSVMVMAYLWI